MILYGGTFSIGCRERHMSRYRAIMRPLQNLVLIHPGY
jgi:hypothetical protein